MTALDALLNAPVYDLPQREKQALLLARLNELTDHHARCCEPYARLLHAGDFSRFAAHEDELMPLAIRLFKHLQLKSIDDADVFKTLTSSGTSGAKSQIFLDRSASALQSKILVKILQNWVGRQRLPMLLVEQPALIASRQGFSARGAGALGLSFLGRDHTYALDEQMQPDWSLIEQFCERYHHQPVIIFGFTFMLWQCLLEPLAKRGIKLPLDQAIIFHSGGWKKLEHLAVSHQVFNDRCHDWIGSERVHNFYGMAEQTGSIFVSCEQGHLHTPIFSDILIRHPKTMAVQPRGEAGLIQVISGLPESYPGHSLLTEDLGIWLGDDDCPCGRKGRYFKVLGREQTAEVRGCSDTFS